MGETDGKLVGDAVGATEGKMVGESVGESVGATVGSRVGCAVGVTVAGLPLQCLLREVIMAESPFCPMWL